MQDVLTCSQIMKILQCSKSKAYEIILELNTQLKNEGYKVLRGRVSKSYFIDQYMLSDDNGSKKE